MGKSKWRLLIGLAGYTAALVVVTGAAQAQKFPDRPVRLVVPYPSGASSNDILARQLAPKLTERWRQNVVVDNRSGASGNIGAELVARSRRMATRCSTAPAGCSRLARISIPGSPTIRTRILRRWP